MFDLPLETAVPAACRNRFSRPVQTLFIPSLLNRHVMRKRSAARAAAGVGANAGAPCQDRCGVALSHAARYEGVVPKGEFRHMEIVAHGLWAASAAITAKRSAGTSVRIGWAVWWSAFPDVLAFGPAAVAGLWLRLSGGSNSAPADGHFLPHVHIGLPLYQIGHSLVVFLLMFGIVTILTRRIVWEMMGWLLHILIDIPTHSLRYYATRFLWPVSDYRIDGIAWWTPWFWAATYAALALVYFVMWKKRWLSRVQPSPDPRPG